MSIKTKKVALTMGMDLTSSPYDMTGRTEDTEATPAEVEADRAAWTPPYGSAPLPAAPVWVSPSDGGNVSYRGMQLYWASNVGDIAGGTETGTGSAGLDGLGVLAHELYIGEGDTPPDTPSLKLGPLRNGIISGFNSTSGEPPVTSWTPLKPSTSYALQIAAVGSAGTGPKSAVLHVKTGTADE
ncbi:hypothetical protein EF910_31980 [Streptomyces sp. WAC07149]|uniref:hypothetical protein n=1 Tax=Streptomyces sp. WAC07149 TaxID=2487425 RepID=UPI000F790CC8|nr:hypothetical protein [Streptomyces sp. WAC07149]RST00357.1 hypothetical protein EF910_31980 [Streptomyces sp. WAC07149]